MKQCDMRTRGVVHFGNGVLAAALCAWTVLAPHAAAALSIAVADGEETLTASVVADLGASEDIVKTGAGRLVVAFDLAAALPGWTGAWRVEAGTLVVQHAGAAGPAGGAGVVVADGASVEFDGAKLGSSDLTCPKLSVCGTGVEGAGAIRLTGGTWTHKKMFWTLTGDTLWATPDGNGEVFNYGPAGSIDMGGHTLTVRGNGTAGTLALSSSVPGFFVNPGHIHIEKNMWFKTEQLRFEGSSGNTLAFDGKVKWTVANNPAGSCVWSVVVAPGAEVSVECTSWSSSWPNTGCGWGGPVAIGAGGAFIWCARWGGGDRQSFVLEGPVTGEGKLACYYGYLKLVHRANAIAEIQNYQGRLIAASLATVMPSFANGKFYTNYAQATSVVALVAADCDAAGDAAVKNYFANYPDGFRSSSGKSGFTYLLPVEGWSYESAWAEAFTDEKALLGDAGIEGLPAPAPFTLRGAVTGVPVLKLSKSGTSLALAGGGDIGQVQLANGHMSFGEGFYDLGTERHYVGAVAPDVARLTVGPGAYLGNRGSTAAGTAINVGRSPVGAEYTVRGLVTLAGGTISNVVSMIDGIGTRAPRSQGSFVVEDGLCWMDDASGSWLANVGRDIGGYLSVRGGELHVKQGWFTVGLGAEGKGVFEQLGGTYVHEMNGLGVGRESGRATVYFGGGTAQLATLRACHAIWTSQASAKDVQAAVTVDGTAHVATSLLHLGGASDSTIVLNLNGGVFETPATFTPITQASQVNSAMSAANYTNLAVCLNFNGGELRPASDSSDLLPAHDALKVTVGAGGLALNTRRSNGGTGVYTIKRPLAPATGKGIGAIPVPEAAAWEYTGAPYVEIEGDGWGATALAQFDTAQGLITNILVTSPGCDYTWARARFVKGGAAEDVTVDVTEALVDNAAAGGLSVYGGGALTLSSGNNTYRGATRIGEGTLLVCWTWESYPNEGYGKPISDLVNAGGTFRIGASNSTEIHFPVMAGFGTVEGGCGTDLFNTVVTRVLEVDARDLVAGRAMAIAGRLTLARGMVLRVTHSEALAGLKNGTRLVCATAARDLAAAETPVVEGVADGWVVRVGTQAIRLVRGTTGTAIFVR